jgi:hypothetical protein
MLENGVSLLKADFMRTFRGQLETTLTMLQPPKVRLSYTVF